jgi:CRP-like cAMP-binding protein
MVEHKNSSAHAAKNTKCNKCSLKQFSVFKDCDEEVLDQTFASRVLVNFNKGEYILKEGDTFKGVYFIQEGVAKILKKGNKNKEFILWFARPGDIIGMNAFLNHEDYSFSVMAFEDIQACFIPEVDFKNLIDREPAIGIKLMKDMCEKIDFIEDRITSIAQKKIREQFAEILISLASKNNKIKQGSVSINYSIKDLANIIGTTKNYLYKILSDFDSKRLVSMKNHKLVIRDINKLFLVATGEE